jgi:alanine racemase
VTVRALARVNLAAIERNVARLRRELAPETALCAVVKADGYGHGALPAARAALAGGAARLAIATAAEAQVLRAGGIDAPLLVMGALSPSELDLALGARAEVVAWSATFVAAVAARGGGAAAAPFTSSSTPAWGGWEPATPRRRRASRRPPPRPTASRSPAR